MRERDGRGVGAPAPWPAARGAGWSTWTLAAAAATRALASCWTDARRLAHLALDPSVPATDSWARPGPCAARRGAELSRPAALGPRGDGESDRASRRATRQGPATAPLAVAL